jgi:hypothetical protein
MELGNHSAFLGVMRLTEMLSTFFVHDGGETQKWRLKGHAQQDFWKWICSWAVNLRKPSDLGFDNDGFDLPELVFSHHIVKSEKILDGYLFPMPASTMAERLDARRDTVQKRAEIVAEIIKQKPSEQWMVWCNLNSEADALRRAIPGAVEVRGSDSPESKERALIGFTDEAVRILITKPSIAGFGMNFQCCHNVVFVGLNDSYEQFYQAVRRCWRFGQSCDVNVHIVSADIEGSVVSNIQRKERDAEKL